MIIANPLYDVVFKYLLEDIEIAKAILSAILSENIVHLEVKPQETVIENTALGLRIVRFDFKATIELPNGELKKILIELQRLKQYSDTMRFRKYLGDNYMKEDDVILDDGTIIKSPLPIVTIYILGFNLEKVKNAVVKINREYIDVLTGEKIIIRDDFVEQLTHDSYIIQVRGLPPETKTKLEKILQIFNPKFYTSDNRKLDFTGESDDPIVQKMVNRLLRAIADEELRRKMDLEDEVERILARQSKKKDDIIAEKDQALAEKDQVITEKDQVITEKDRELEALRLLVAELKQQKKE